MGDSQEVNQCPWMSRILNYFTKSLTESVGKQMAWGDYYWKPVLIRPKGTASSPVRISYTSCMTWFFFYVNFCVFQASWIKRDKWDPRAVCLLPSALLAFNADDLKDAKRLVCSAENMLTSSVLGHKSLYLDFTSGHSLCSTDCPSSASLQSTRDFQ